ncbi:MAG: metalloregulator ArsR/SmtB family transcription factor [Planctomycetia bacterium]|nr:metalloregulator ArsR/SmtB family transcription factor [Planctomycetia bacterium]
MEFTEKEWEKNCQQVQIFKALAHPTRLGIVRMLRKGELCVCVFQEEFGVDFSTISRHLAILRNAGIVHDKKRGKNVFYRLVKPCVLDMCECLERENSCDGKRCSP